MHLLRRPVSELHLPHHECRPDQYERGALNFEIGRDAVLITNPTVKPLLGEKIKDHLVKAGFSVKFEEVPDTEQSKSQVQLFNLLCNIAAYDVRRKIFIVALGGGVIGDLAGLVAAIYRRGIPYIQIPTTLLAQVDSSIGGKVGIDLPHGKNLVGAFYQPAMVFSDISVLENLPLRQIRTGLAEVVKYAVISDEVLFTYIQKNAEAILKCDRASLEHIVYSCSKIKARIVEKDEKETAGLRTILNFGHTSGHAIEAASGYSDIFTHGEAVSLGMLCACEIANQMGMLGQDIMQKIEDLLIKLGLPTKIKHLNLDQILKAQEHDKKYIHGETRLVLPTRIGHVSVVEGIPLEEITKAIQKRM